MTAQLHDRAELDWSTVTPACRAALGASLTGEPGEVTSHRRGVGGHVFEVLLHWNAAGEVDGFLQRIGSRCVLQVAPASRRQGVATQLGVAARARGWVVEFEAQSYSDAGARFVATYLTRTGRGSSVPVSERTLT